MVMPATAGQAQQPGFMDWLKQHPEMLMAMGGSLGSLFGGGNKPSDKANKYLDQIGGAAGKYLDPYAQGGQKYFEGGGNTFLGGIQDPSGFLNQIGAGYKESPGLKFQIQKQTDAANRAASAGGMAGSPAAQQTNMELANDLASQDYNNYIQNALGFYNTNASGTQNMANLGQQSAQSMADYMAQVLGQKGRNAFEEQNQQTNPFATFGGAMGPFIPWLLGL